MIDWYLLGFSALWIFGLGLFTASLSFAYYQAHEQKQSFRQVLGMSRYQIMVNSSLVLFCVGWLGAFSVLWERLALTILALLFALQIWLAMKKSKV